VAKIHPPPGDSTPAVDGKDVGVRCGAEQVSVYFPVFMTDRDTTPGFLSQINIEYEIDPLDHAKCVSSLVDRYVTFVPPVDTEVDDPARLQPEIVVNMLRNSLEDSEDEPHAVLISPGESLSRTACSIRNSEIRLDATSSGDEFASEHCSEKYSSTVFTALATSPSDGIIFYSREVNGH